MEYNFPSVLWDHFKNEALRSCDQNDQAGTFAIALGRKIDSNVIDTHCDIFRLFGMDFNGDIITSDQKNMNFVFTKGGSNQKEKSTL